MTNPQEHSFIYTESSHNVEVEVRPEYVPERSNPSVSYYFYTYTVKIRNLGTQTCQLLSRHWIIRDGTGKEEHVQGEGVVGVRPEIPAGNSFEYTSFCPLRTPTGNMRGSYEMMGPKQDHFKVAIPLFFLRPPHSFH